MKPVGWLWPLSIPYRLIVDIRNRFFDLGVFSTIDCGIPVISVGNISVGGTGKTPFVIHVVKRLQNMSSERKPIISVISRGYKGKSQNTLLVSDGKRILSDPFTSGDEPYMIAETLQSAVVAVDRKRVRGAKYIVDNFKTRAIILDDGFQHRSLKRDLDIVLLDARNPVGTGRMLPAGILREPVSSLKRADLVILSKSESSDDLPERCSKLANLIEKPVLASTLTPRYWRRLGKGELFSADQIAGKNVVAFAGIARPTSFFETIESLGGNIVTEIPLPDHCSYSKFYLDKIARIFTKSRADWMVTTAKDAVKIPPILKLLPLYYLDSEINMVVGANELDSKLSKLLK